MCVCVCGGGGGVMGGRRRGKGEGRWLEVGQLWWEKTLLFIFSSAN